MKSKLSKFKEGIRFFIKYFRHPFLNASLVPSSRAAVSAMLNGIDFVRIKTVVELGAGTGPYTEEIVHRAPANTKIILVELDSDYARLLREKFGARVIVENIGAEHLSDVLRRNAIEFPDLIVSSLPFLPLESRNKLFDVIRRCVAHGTIFRFEIILKPWGIKIYKSLPIEQKAFVFRCVPPLWIYGIN